MKRLLAIALLLSSLEAAASATPLTEPGWELVARMSDEPSNGGMFDGNGDLRATYSFGTFSNDPGDTNDFYRPFPVVANEILFITGDGLYWGIADYASLLAIIDAEAGVFGPNLQFRASLNGGPETTTTGNVLMRASQPEDPWISLSGTHNDGITNGLIIWGENDYGAATHQALKNAHDGVNVYVRAEVPVPEPAGAAMLGLVALAASRRVRRLASGRSA